MVRCGGYVGQIYHPKRLIIQYHFLLERFIVLFLFFDVRCLVLKLGEERPSLAKSVFASHAP